uniref:CD24 n=1 Tax=Macaca fascicularis TaxID=9541 RepID=A0A7N9D3B9_MACFA
MGRAMVARLGLGLLLLALLLPTQSAALPSPPQFFDGGGARPRETCPLYSPPHLLSDQIFSSNIIYSTVTTSAPLSSNSSQNTSTTPNPANTTTKAVGGALQSTASLFVVSLSLLHLYC